MVIYVSPTGSGARTGASAANALPVTSLDNAIQLAGAGGTVMMLADRGTYDLTSTIAIAHGGTTHAPVTIMGVDSAGHELKVEIEGTRPLVPVVGMLPGNEVFTLLAGANHLVFENMSFANVGTAFRAGADITNIVIQDMYADNVSRFFLDSASGTSTSATVSDLTIRNVEVHGYSHNVVRLQYDSHDIVIDNVRGDSERQDVGAVTSGIHLTGTAHDVLISNSTMMNSRSTMNGSSGYWNGDGFGTERGVYDVTFANTVARGNADGGYDLKSTDTVLINAVAEDNGRNFRVWGEATLIDPVGIDPHKWGGTGAIQAQIQIISGGKATVLGGTFADSGSLTNVVVNHGGAITFNDTHLIYAQGARLSTGEGSSGTLGIDPALVRTVPATGSYSTDGERWVDSPPALTLSDAGVTDNASDAISAGFAMTRHQARDDTFSHRRPGDDDDQFAIDAVTGVLDRGFDRETNGIKTADFQIELMGAHQLTSSDFLL